MRAVVLLLACSVLADSRRPDQVSTSYEVGKEYVYRYESKAVVGVPNNVLQNGGLVIRADIKFKPVNRNQIIAQVSSVELKTLTSAVPNQEDIPEDILQPVDQQVQRQIQESLQKPIIFKYQAGQVSDVWVHNSVPAHVINIIKGMIPNLMQLKLRDDSDEGRQQQKLWSELTSSNVPQDDIHRNYKVIEDGIEGKCESIYSIRPYITSVMGMRVQKVRNYQKCPERVILEHGILSGLTSRGMEHKTRDMISQHASSDYKLLGQPQSFIVGQVNSTAKYIVQLLSDKHGLIVASVNQSLALKSILDPSEPTPEPQYNSMKLLKEPLKHQFPHYTFDQPETISFHGVSSPEKVARVVQTLRSCKQALDPAHEQAPQAQDLIFPLMRQLKKELRHLSCEDLVHVLSRVADDEAKKQLFLDAVPTVGTPEGLKFIAKRLQTAQQGPQLDRVISDLKTISLHLDPNHEVIQMLKPRNSSLLTRRVIQDKNLKKGVLLSMGSILHRVKVHANNSATQRDLIKPQLKEITRQFHELFHREDDEGKVVVVKAMANSGLPNFLPIIKDILRDISRPSTVRMAAIFAVRRMSKQYKPLVTQVVLPVYTEPHEPHELRIAAYAILMDKQPINSTLEIIVRTQQDERNIQVGTFVYNHLLAMSKARLPGLAKVSAAVRRILPLVKAFSPKEYTYSMPYHKDLVSDYLDIGAGLDVHKLHDSRSPLPSFVVAKLSAHAIGRSGGVLEAGLQGQGLKMLLSKVFGPYQHLIGRIQDKSWDEMIDYIVQEPVQMMPEYGQVLSELSRIDEQLGIQDRDLSEELNLSGYIKYLGNELHFFNFTKEDIARLSDQNNQVGSYSDVPQSSRLNILRALVLSKQSVKIPTPMGVALGFNTSMTMVTRVKGAYEQTEYSYLDVLKSLLGYKDLGINVDVQAKTSTAHEIKGAVGVDMEVLSAGITYKDSKKIMNLPLDISATISKRLGQTKVELKYDTPSQKQTLVRGTYQPAAFACSRVVDSERLEEFRSRREILKNPLLNQPLEAQVSVDAQSLGVRLDLKTKLDNPRAEWMRFPQFSESNFTLEMTPLQPGETILLKLEYVRSNQPDEQLTQNYRTSSRVSEDVDPSIIQPCKHLVEIKAGPQHDSLRAHSISAILAHTPQLTVMQLKAAAKLPGITPSQHNVDILLNLKSLANRVVIEDQDRQLLLRAKYTNQEGSSVQLNVQPQQREPIVFDSLQENVIYKLLKEKLDIDIDVRKQQQCPVIPSRKFQFSLQYNQLSDNMLAIADYLNKTITASIFPSYIWKSSVSSRSSYPSPSGSIDGQVKMVRRLEKAIVQLRTPSQRELKAEIPLRSIWSTPYQEKYSVVRPAINSSTEQQHLDDSINFHFDTNIISHLTYGQCKVKEVNQATEIRTFDKKTYRLPDMSEHQCEVVLAKDCSPSRLFTIIMSQEQGEKKLRLLVPQHKVQLEPVSTWSFSRRLQARVDGQLINTPSSGQHQLTDPDGSVWAKVSKEDDKVKLELSKIGIIVTTDSRNVSIMSCGLLRAGLCGLCGDYNGEPTDDYRSPNQQVLHQDERPFVADYIVPSDSCPIARIRESWQAPDISRRNCQPEQKTNITEMILFGEPHTCFSLEPSTIRKCPQGCVPVQSRQVLKQVKFVCLPANDIKALSIKQRINAGTGRIEDVRLSEPVKYKFENVPEPLECISEEVSFRSFF